VVDNIARAMSATKESRGVDFKRELDLGSPSCWPELVKDIVSMANSGGGLLVVGLEDDGRPSGCNVEDVLALDPAVVTDKVHKYTHVHFADFEILERRKGRRKLAVFEIGGSDTPIVFTDPGTYMRDKKHKSAFSKGSVYFRHGAKSEPGTSADVRKAFERQLNAARKAWLAGVKAVSHAGPEARVVTLAPGQRVVASSSTDAIPIRLTDDPTAPAYHPVDYDITHPYLQKALVARVNKRLSGAAKVNAYDIQCVNRVCKEAHEERFRHSPKFSSTQYSEEFVDWLVGEVKKDPEFFQKMRAESYRATH